MKTAKDNNIINFLKIVVTITFFIGMFVGLSIAVTKAVHKKINEIQKETIVNTENLDKREETNNAVR